MLKYLGIWIIMLAVWLISGGCIATKDGAREGRDFVLGGMIVTTILMVGIYLVRI